MLDELVNYYKKNLTAHSLVFKYMKTTYTLSTYLLVLLLVSGYLMIMTLPLFFVGIKIALYFLIAFAAVLVLSIIVVANISKKAKRVLRNHYGINVNNGMWRTAEFDSMQTDLLISYLESKNVYSKEKLEKIIILLEKEIERSKTPSFVAPSIFIALFIPVWSQYIIFLFKGIKENSVNEASLLIVALILIIFFVALGVGTFKKFVQLGEDFFMIESNIRKKFASKIEDLLLRHCDDGENEDRNSKETSLILIRRMR